MALANPLSQASLADLLPIADVTFRPMWAQEGSLTGSGEPLYSDRAPMRWSADVTTGPMRWSLANRIMALINSRGGGLKTILLANPRAWYPAGDPGGALFGAATPLVGTITDRLHVAFTGFPNGYVIPAGTFFRVLFDTSRYYLGQFAEDKTANGSGAVSETEITPALPASVDTGDAVTVAKPQGKFIIVPNSAYPSQANATRAIVRFSAEQTYAA